MAWAKRDERVGHVVVRTYGDALPPLRTQVVALNKIEYDTHAGMGQRAAGMRLDGHTRKRERPRIAELAVDHVRAVAAACRAEKTAVRFEPHGRCGKSERSQLRRDHAAFRRAAGVKRPGQCAEVLA